MSGRFFLDTNIFVYSFDANAPKKAAQATKLIRKGIETRGGIVSYQVVQEFFNVALRRFVRPMSSVDAEQYLSTTFRPLLAVHSSLALYGEARAAVHLHSPTGGVSGVETGLLIQTSLGTAGGLGALRTKRSG